MLQQIKQPLQLFRCIRHTVQKSLDLAYRVDKLYREGHNSKAARSRTKAVHFGVDRVGGTTLEFEHTDYAETRREPLSQVVVQENEMQASLENLRQDQSIRQPYNMRVGCMDHAALRCGPMRPMPETISERLPVCLGASRLKIIRSRDVLPTLL